MSGQWLFARLLFGRAPDITRRVDRLEERGFVQPVRGANNRRVVDIAFTPAKRELLDPTAEGIAACRVAELGHPPAGQLQKLIDLLLAARSPHEQPLSLWIET